MGSPVVCAACGRENGLLAETCRGEICGRTITRDGELHCPQDRYEPFAWETKSVTQIIADGELKVGAQPDQRPLLNADDVFNNLVAEFQGTVVNDEASEKFSVLNAHDFLRYCLLLRTLKSQFEKDDLSIWFDDCLFLLRGGFNFALYLNLDSPRFVCRGRIFGGLTHGRRPQVRLVAWLKRLITEANARGRDEIDVFVADEVNAGHSIRRFLHTIFSAVQDIANDRSLVACIRFHFFLIINDCTKFDPTEFFKQLNSRKPKKRRIAYDKNYILVSNDFRILQGPLLTYDCDIYSGLRRSSEGGDYEETYEAIRVPTRHFQIRCPDTLECLYAYAINEKSRADLLIKETLCNIGRGLYFSNRKKCQLCEELIAGFDSGIDIRKHIDSYRLPVDALKVQLPKSTLV